MYGKRTCRGLVWVLLCAACLGSKTVHAENPVYFADANLKAAVEAELGKTNPMSGDMRALTALMAHTKGIGSLIGLEYATNLSTLSVQENQISDISPLAGLNRLRLLNIGCNTIANVSVLAGLTNLEYLSIFSNNISDIGPLTGLVRLKHLSLGWNPITDISCLASLTNLTHLWMEQIPVENLSPVAGLWRLEYVDLGGTNSDDISAISGLTNLSELGIAWNQVYDLSPLSALTKLTRLDMNFNQIADLSPLAGLTHLEILYASYNQITSAAALAGLTNLQALYLYTNEVSDISALSGLPNLRQLDVRNNPLDRNAYCQDLGRVLLTAPQCFLAYDINTNPPGGASATDGTHEDKVVITWDALCSGPNKSNMFEYMVYRSSSPGGIKEPIAGWLTGTSYDDTTAVPGVRYSYWVISSMSPNDYGDSDEGWCAVSSQRVLYISSTNGGMVSTPGVGSFEYDHGTSVPVVAAPTANYHFVNWTGTAVTAGKVANSLSASTSVTLEADYTLQANFAINAYTLMVNATNGTVAATPNKSTYAHGETVILQAMPNTGYHFTGWSGDMSGTTNPIAITMDGNKTATAAFALNTYALTVNAMYGIVLRTPDKTSYSHGETVALQAMPNTGYHFAEWTGDVSGSVNPITVIMEADKTIAAGFAVNSYTLTANAAHGVVVRIPDKASYDHGETVTLQAAADTGFVFADWSGDLSGSANPTTITMDGDKTVTANFAVGQWTLTVSAGSGGAVTAPGEGTFEYGDGEVITLHAQPDPLFVFVGWRGSMFTSENPYSVAMDADHTVKAHFESILDVLYVNDDSAGDPGPGDPNVSDPQEDGTPEHPFDRVQEAIDVARTGAQVVVRSGTYFETIDFLGKSIEVNGLDAGDPNNMAWPVIDGGGKDTVVRCTSGEDPKCILRGLVITGGRGWLGGGILCVSGSPTILNCLIAGNRAMSLDAGGGIHCQDSNTILINCTIASNCGGSAGAGVCLSQSNATILDSIVWENTPTQIKLLGSGNSIVAYTAAAGGWPGDGILDADPLFAQPGYWADPANITKVLPATDPLAVWIEGDYHLMSQAGRWDPISRTWLKDPVTSPCIDAGDPDSPIGPEPLSNGGRVNTGVYGGTTQASMSTGDG